MKSKDSRSPLRKCELGLKRYKTVENISDEDMDKAVEEQEVEFGRARGDAVAGGEGHDHAWKDFGGGRHANGRVAGENVCSNGSCTASRGICA